MHNLKNNRLLLVTLGLLALYWTVTPFVSNPFLSSFFSLLLLIFSTLTVAQYSVETWRILFMGLRSADELGRGRGSHLAIYGVFLLGLGSMMSGAYGLWWNVNGQPLSWIGSPASQFGRSMQVVGFILMQAAPEVTQQGLEIKKTWMAIVLGCAILIGIGFWLGLQVKLVEATDGYKALRFYGYTSPAPCVDDRTMAKSARIIFN